MAAARTATVSTASPQSLSTDASYLRQLLERQPACLVRVRLDGVLLACNDAALSLFGGDTLAAILDTNLTDRIVAAERADWKEFAARVWTKGAASFECHLGGPEGDPRTVLLQGIALTTHPDGLDSLLLNLRDQTQTRRLEQLIHSAEINRAGREEDVESDQAERQRLTDALAAEIADSQRKEAAYRARFAELERAVAERQLELMTGAREQRDRIAGLEAELAAASAQQSSLSRVEQHLAHGGLGDLASLDQYRRELVSVELRLQAATAESARLLALVTENEVQRAQLADRHRAAVAIFEQTLAEAEKERDEARRAPSELRAQLTRALADYEARREQTAAAHRAAVGKLEQSLAKAGEERDEARRALSESRSQLTQAQAEHEAQREELAAKHRAAVATLERALAAAVEERDEARQAPSELRLQLSQAQGEHEAQREQLAATHRAAVASLERALGAAVEERDQAREAPSELRLQLSQAHAEHEAQREQLAADHRAAVGSLEQLLTTAGEERDDARQALSELRPRLAQALAEHRGQREQMAAEHRAAVATLEQALAMAGEERDEARQTLSELRPRLAQALADHKVQREQMAAEHRAAVGAIEQTLATVHGERDEARQALSELRSQLAQAEAGHEVERGQMAAEHRAAVGALEQSLAAAGEERDQIRQAMSKARSQLSQALAEQTRLSAIVEEQERERDRVTAEHHQTVADLETSKSEALAECERVLTEIREALLARHDSVVEVERRLAETMDEAAREKAAGDQIVSLQTELGMVVSQLRLQTLPVEEDQPQEGVSGDRAADGARAERTPDVDILEEDGALKALVDQHAELLQWRETAIELEPLAAAGRLAATVARELQEILGRVDARAQLLLTRGTSEAGARSHIESLRADALRAASLARQFATPTIRQPEAATAAAPEDARPAAETPDDSSEDS